MPGFRVANIFVVVLFGALVAFAFHYTFLWWFIGAFVLMALVTFGFVMVPHLLFLRKIEKHFPVTENKLNEQQLGLISKTVAMDREIIHIDKSELEAFEKEGHIAGDDIVFEMIAENEKEVERIIAVLNKSELDDEDKELINQYMQNHNKIIKDVLKFM